MVKLIYWFWCFCGWLERKPHQWEKKLEKIQVKLCLRYSEQFEVIGLRRLQPKTGLPIITEHPPMPPVKEPMTAEEENLANTKPCPHNSAIQCVQFPEDSCGCNPCEECEQYKGDENESD